MTPEEIIRQILEEVGAAELAEARRRIGSGTLRRALTLIVEESQARARLFIPHYWAVYYHDGRDGFGPVSANKLVFFDRPEDDPRLEGGYPVRASEIRRLTRDEYVEGLERNAERRRNGLRPFMYVVDSVGPQAGRPFFDEMADGASERAGPTAAMLFDRWVQRIVDEDPDVRPEKRTAGFAL